MTIADPSAAMARMQERQASWSRKARETSDASATASASSTSDTSPSQDRPLHPASTSSSTGPIRPSPSRSTAAAKRNANGKVTRKKVAKACLSCQKSHLTCDEARPCTRCTKKGIGDQCVEGVRKKAKYLMEGDERAAPPPAPAAAAPAPAPVSVPAAPQPSLQPHAPHAFSASPPNFGSIPVSMLPGVTVAPSQPADTVRVPDNIWLTAPLPEVQAAPVLTDWNTTSNNNDMFNFTSSAAANLEYEMFDSMFGSMSPSFPLGDLGSNDVWNNFGLGDPSPNTNPAAANPDGVLLTPQGDAGISPMMVNELSPNMSSFNSHSASNGWTQQGLLDDMIGVPPADLTAPPRKKLTPEDVYSNVVKPYDYTEGYHILMQYLTQNYEKQDILRVVRALAAFRPSLIALQMPMSEEDEVFLERSFQRTLIELDKLISYSATPTAVWRRTGEVVAVAPQFCQLLGKTEDEIIASRTCIYQLFSKAATIEYWENFAVHAFENTTQNFFQQTTLETPKGSIPCAACFTIRRDVFDLPSVIIGQFLPIPQDAM